MVLAAVVIRGGTVSTSSRLVDDHATFLLEAIVIGLLGIFWTLQTIDRRARGAHVLSARVSCQAQAKDASTESMSPALPADSSRSSSSKITFTSSPLYAVPSSSTYSPPLPGPATR